MTMYYGVDISSHNGKPDWSKLSFDFVILRSVLRNGDADSSFEHNYKGCIENDIPVGVYKFSYAMSVSEIEEEARAVIKLLNGRNLALPVWLDLEYEEQCKLSETTLSKMIKAFRQIIIDNGYQFGIYTGYFWYNHYIPDDCKQYDFWIARYSNNDDGTVKSKLKPAFGVGWQYSERGKVSGLMGDVDMDVFYIDYTYTDTEDEKENNMAIDTSWIKTDFSKYAGKISNSGHDENGKLKNGKAGDQTGHEWEIRTWYNRPWTVVMRHPNEEIGRAIASIAIEAANNNKIGYDQNQRTTYWKRLTESGYRPSAIKTACEADCSAGAIANVKAVGYLMGLDKLKKVSENAYSGNIRGVLYTAGFEALTGAKYTSSSNYLKPGDILIYENHHVATSVCYGSKATQTIDKPVDTKKGYSGTYPILPKRGYFKEGDNDYQVKLLQKLLNWITGSNIAVDGEFGKKTLAAVKSAQSILKVKVDGYFGKASLAAAKLYKK